MIVITGSSGFIGSCLLSKLNYLNFKDIVLVDNFDNIKKEKNYSNNIFSKKINRKDFFYWLNKNEKFIQFIFHLGARTNTLETNIEILNELNFQYSVKIWNTCVKFGIPFLYASSASVYGSGEFNFDDYDKNIDNYKPLNLYAQSKLKFDLWCLSQKKQPYFWAGLRFFNVYGPNEYHKGPMRSMVLNLFDQITSNKSVNLFKSHKSNCNDGEQKRDFIYVKDVIEVLVFFLLNRKNSGIYNVGSGESYSFNYLANIIFENCKIIPKFNYIDIPVSIREKYQYFTKSNQKKLRSIGYNYDFFTLREGIKDYFDNYLTSRSYF